MPEPPKIVKKHVSIHDDIVEFPGQSKDFTSMPAAITDLQCQSSVYTIPPPPVPAASAPAERLPEPELEGTMAPSPSDCTLVLNYTVRPEFTDWFKGPLKFKELVHYTLAQIYGVRLNESMKMESFAGFRHGLTRSEFSVVATFKFGLPSKFVKTIVETAEEKKAPFMHIMFEILFGMLCTLTDKFSTYFLDDATGKLNLKFNHSAQWSADHTTALRKLIRDNVTGLTPEELQFAPKRLDGRMLTTRIFTL